MKKITLLGLFMLFASSTHAMTLSGVLFNGVSIGSRGESKLVLAGDTTALTKQIMTINEFSGKCPICEKEGKKSKVFERGCHSTLMANYAYYDEDGSYHYHDPNVTTCRYECSNGHVFSVTK